jgi:glycosyltransferase involved in cell wall biosynthesis
MSRPAEPNIVVVLSKIFPIPPAAGSPRPYHLLTRLSERARLHCVAGVTARGHEWSEFIEAPALRSSFESVQVRHGRTKHPAWALPLMFLTGRARHDLRFRDPRLLRETREQIVQVAREHDPVRFLCMGMGSLQFVPRRLWGSCIVDSVDPESLILGRLARGSAGLTRAQRIKFSIGGPAMRRLEQTMFREVSAVAYNSSTDIAYLRSLHPDAPIVRVIDGCDTDYFSPESAAEIEEEPDSIMFNGHMGYAPNLDAACHLVDDIMPHVWKRRPHTRVYLVGPDPDRGLARFRDERVVVTGFVDDVRVYLKRASVVVSSLRLGTGMKNKLQAGLAMRRAMVVSSVTGEGFDGLEPGRHAILADDPSEFAEAVCGLLADPERRARMGEAGQRLIRDHFSWDSAIDALWGAIQACPQTSVGQEPG